MERAGERLAEADLIWLTTVSADGRPQSSPVWFLWDAGAVLVATEPRAPKVINVAANPAVALHLDGAAPGDLVVSIEGTAAVGGPVPAAPYEAKYAPGLRRLGTTVEDYLARFSASLTVVPTRWRVFRSL